MTMNVNVNVNVNVNDLRDRFLHVLSEAGAQRPGHALFDELVARYGQAHRHYHTIAHVDACLGYLDWYRGSAQHSERIELALWFHDAVYDPAANDNERQSAFLARARLGELCLPEPTIVDIESHIRATQQHQPDQRGLPDTDLMLDLDLSILGAPTPTFARFEQAIREEYAHVPELTFAIGRRALLIGFLARPEIYRTPALAEELEARARVNLERRVLELSAAHECP
jgi:predicted metal-dependent HD superfamily phosphohydrolase